MNRRQFLKQCGLISSGVVLTPTLADILQFCQPRFWALDKTMMYCDDLYIDGVYTWTRPLSADEVGAICLDRRLSCYPYYGPYKELFNNTFIRSSAPLSADSTQTPIVWVVNP